MLSSYVKGGDDMERIIMGEQSAKYFFDHYNELTEQYGHKFLVIYDCKVIGAYDTKEEAISKGSDSYMIGTFAIQETGVTEEPHLYNITGGTL